MHQPAPMKSLGQMQDLGEDSIDEIFARHRGKASAGAGESGEAGALSGEGYGALRSKGVPAKPPLASSSRASSICVLFIHSDDDKSPDYRPWGSREKIPGFGHSSRESSVSHRSESENGKVKTNRTHSRRDAE